MNNSVRLDGIDATQLAKVRQLLPHCESLGDNCEFGFLMQELAYDKGGLLRWAVAPLQPVVQYIEQPPQSLYDFDALVPMNTGMVLDGATRFGFHTSMYSAAEGETFRFVDDEQTRRQAHVHEHAKVSYLAENFRARLRDGHCLFVVKRNQNLTQTEVSGLLQALRANPGFATSSLLVVRHTPDAELAGTLTRQHADLMEGWVNRFAPYSLANDIDFVSWVSVLSKAAEKFGD
jgi:hypothetical protein